MHESVRIELEEALRVIRGAVEKQTTSLRQEFSSKLEAAVADKDRSLVALRRDVNRLTQQVVELTDENLELKAHATNTSTYAATPSSAGNAHRNSTALTRLLEDINKDVGSPSPASTLRRKAVEQLSGPASKRSSSERKDGSALVRTPGSCRSGKLRSARGKVGIGSGWAGELVLHGSVLLG